MRQLVAHLVLIADGMAEQLGTRADGPAVPLASFVARYGPAAQQLDRRTRERAGALTPAELVA